MKSLLTNNVIKIVLFNHNQDFEQGVYHYLNKFVQEIVDKVAGVKLKINLISLFVRDNYTTYYQPTMSEIFLAF